MIQKLGMALVCAFLAAGLVIGFLELRDDRADALRDQLRRATNERTELARQVDQTGRLTVQLLRRIRDLERFIRAQGFDVPVFIPSEPSSSSGSGDSSQPPERDRRERPEPRPKPKPSPRPSPKPSPDPGTCVVAGPASVCIQP